MDTLISIGTLAAWGWSGVVLLAGLDAGVYFEVAGVTTTLVLLGRFLEARARRRVRKACVTFSLRLQVAYLSARTSHSST